MTQQRILPLPKEQWTDASREVQSFWGEPNAWEEGSKTNILQVMANHPELGKVYNVWGKQLLMGNTLTTRHLELIILRIAWTVQNEYEWHYHVGYGLNADITLEEISAIREDLRAEDWSDIDFCVLSAVDELMKDNRISDGLWEKLGQHFDTRQKMDLVFTTGHYVMTSWALSSFAVPVEAWNDQIGFDLRTKSGKIPTKSYKPGEAEGWADGRD